KILSKRQTKQQNESGMSIENGSRCPRWSTAIYGTRLNELDTTRRILKSKAMSVTRDIIAKTYGSKANSIGKENTDNNMKAIDNTKKDEKGKGKEIITETEKENNETNEQNITNTKTEDNGSVNSEDSFLSVHEEWRKKINLQKYKAWIKTGEVHGKNLKDKIEITGECRAKIVNTVLKTCHRCHAEDHLVIICLVAKDFEKYGQLYKRQRPQLYKSLMGRINMGTSYSDAVKNNINRKTKNNIMEKNDTTNENIMN
ncbi:2039_t:CDS:2, partial [Diversispora eburnea]